MGAIIDLIIVAIIGLTIYLAMKRGFIKTVFSALGGLVALVAAILLSSPLSIAFQDGVVGEKLVPVVESVVDETITEETLNGCTQAGGEIEKLCTLLGGEDKTEALKAKCKDMLHLGTDPVRDTVKDALTESGVVLCCDVLAFVILFIVIRILVKIAEIVLDKFVDLPVLRTANTLFGGAAGALLALFRVYIFCFALKLLLPLMGDMGVKAAFGNSMLYGFFDSINFLAIVF